MSENKEAALIAELRAQGQIAPAIFIEAGTTKLHWEALSKCRAEGVKPSEFVDALVSNALATVHSVCKMVGSEPFTESVKTLILLRVLEGVEKIGK